MISKYLITLSPWKKKTFQYRIVYKLKRIVIFWYLAAEVYQVGVRVVDWEHDAVAELKRCNYGNNYEESRFGSQQCY